MATAKTPSAENPLARYNAKRDFSKTAEPAGTPGETPDSHLFMVQKHDATRLHWDFRLELQGVLKSWAVTRGPSLDPADKRLAVRTEDHPLGYATFEGTIPKGEYGGGTVMLWDRGTWTPLPGKDPIKTLAEGHLHFTLDGERMKGEWIMIRLKPRGREKGENWLLRKVEDLFSGGSDDLVGQAITSVATGRTMAEIAEGKTVPVTKAPKARAKASAAKPAGKRAATKMPAFREPQLATLVDTVPTGSGWIHEVKYDGYRLLLGAAGGEAKAWTRTGLDWSDRFAPIVEAASVLPGSALIDGEVVAMDPHGHPSFQLLQAALKEGSTPLQYFAFDLLEQDGEDLAALPTTERKARLAALLDGVDGPIAYAEHVTGSGEAMFEGICAEGLEGIISKRADAPYRAGRRSPAWLKIKCTRRQEFVIVGWTPSDKSRGFRSLLLGLHEGEALHYAGKVGTGFDERTIEDLLARMAPLARKEPTVTAPRAAVRGAHWIEPTLVAEVAFAEFTGDGVLRHASFLGLREDKPASAVIEEKPEPLPKAKTAAKAKAPPAPPAVPENITHPERVIYPESGLTKGQLATYYAQLAGPLLEWLGHRPVSLVRCPQGRAKQCFFQKHDSGSFGSHVLHVPIREKDGSTEPYLYVDDAAGLMACVQMNTLEFHGWGSNVDDVEKPDRLVFDLDPDEGLDFDLVKTAAVMLRDELAGLGLRSWPMLSGGKGIHVVVPLTPEAEWPAVKDFASRFSRAIAEAHPDRFTANMKKVERHGRIFLDWLRNQRGATAVMPYSARARAGAPVAAPVTWEELRDITTAARWTILDGHELITRAASTALKGWADEGQTLPGV